MALTGRRGPQRCETSRLPKFLYSRLTDGLEDVSLTCQVWFLNTLYLAVRNGGPSAARKTRENEKIHLIWSRTRDFPACNSAVTTTLPVAPIVT
jgi:hypothetical protein